MKNLTFKDYPHIFSWHDILKKQVNKEAEKMIKDEPVVIPKYIPQKERYSDIVKVWVRHNIISIMQP